jgi:hypothetical protein
VNLFFVAHVNNGYKLNHSIDQVSNTARFMKREYKSFSSSRILSSNESAVFAGMMNKILGIKKRNEKAGWLNYKNYVNQNSQFEITDRILRFARDKKGLKNLIIITRSDIVKTVLDVLIRDRSFKGKNISLSEYKHGALFLADRSERIVKKLFEPAESHHY